MGLNSRWQITVTTEYTTDFSGRSEYIPDHDDMLTNHTFGQTFNYVRGFFKTRGGLKYTKPSWEKPTEVEEHGWNMFNFHNEPDFEWHIDEELFVKKYTDAMEGAIEYYSKWMDTESGASIYARDRAVLENYGLICLRVYRVQEGLGRILIETVYIKRLPDLE